MVIRYYSFIFTIFLPGGQGQVYHIPTINMKNVFSFALAQAN